MRAHLFVVCVFLTVVLPGMISAYRSSNLFDDDFDEDLDDTSEQLQEATRHVQENANDGATSSYFGEIETLKRKMEELESNVHQLQLQSIENRLSQLEESLQLVRSDGNNRQGLPSIDVIHRQGVNSRLAQLEEMIRDRRPCDTNDTEFSTGSRTSNVFFTAYLDHTVTTLGKDQTIIFNQVLSNAGEAYKPIDGHFTCPVGGVYLFAWNVLVHPRTVTHTALVINGENKLFTAGDAWNADTYTTPAATAIVGLEAGDVVWIAAVYGSKVYSQNAKPFCSFSGVLLK